MDLHVTVLAQFVTLLRAETRVGGTSSASSITINDDRFGSESTCEFRLHGVSLLMDSPMDDIAPQLVRFTAELVCLMCGGVHGTLDGGSSWPPRREALLSRPGGEQPTPVTGWWRLRCTSCGGALLATDITSQAVRPEAAVDWRTEGIRRGRPPNWIVAERAAADVPRSA